MDPRAENEKRESGVFTWAVIGGIAITFLLWGLLIFFVIGEKGPPAWDFSVIPDIPGESAYSTHTPISPHGRVPIPVEPQHVMGPPAKAAELEGPGK